MKAMNSYQDGLKLVVSYPKYWLVFYGFNVLFAIIIAYPAHVLISRYFGHSLRADYFLNQFDFMAIVNFLRDNASGLSALSATLLILGLLYGFLQFFLMGGIYSIYIQEDSPTDLSSFWKLCSLYFWKFFKILLIGFLLFLFTVFVYFLLMAILGYVKPYIPSEILSSLLRGGALFSILLLVLFFDMLLDYTKTFLVLNNQKSAMLSFVKAGKFVFRHLGSTIFLYFLLLLTEVFLIAAYLFSSRFFDGRSLLFIGILFLLQQAFVFLEIGLRLQFFASQIVLVKRKKWPFSYF